jgi:hypothetical protein
MKRYTATKTHEGTVIGVRPSVFVKHKTSRQQDFHTIRPEDSRTLVAVIYIEGEQLLSRDDWSFTLDEISAAAGDALTGVKHMEAVAPRALRIAIQRGYNEFFAARLRGGV